MNISYNWLKEYININLPVEEVSQILTSIGLEVGSVEEVQTVKRFLGLVIGEVRLVFLTKIPSLHVTTVNRFR